MISKKSLLFFLLLMSCGVQAQLTDSLLVKQNSFYNDIQVRLFETPLFFTSENLSDFTQTQIDFEQKSMPFKRVQTAEESTKYTFSTQGVFNLKPRLRLFGNFVFNEMIENDLGYNFSTQRTEEQNILSPNYFFAPKKGNWEIQKYYLNGGLSYQLESNILLAATVFYTNSKNYRKIDPRPRIALSHYGGELHAGYVYQSHRVFGSVGIAKKTETTDIIYVDSDLNAPAYPETFTTFSSGYGRVVFNSTYNKYIFNTIDKNFGLGYQYQKDRNSLNLGYKFNKSMEDFYGKDANNEIYIDDALIQYRYRFFSNTAKLNYYHDGELKDYKVQLEYKSSQGDNFSVAENGQNFRMNLDRFQFNSGIIKKEQDRVLYNFELNAAYAKHKYIDLLGSTNKKLNTLEIQTIFNKDVFVNEKNKLNLEFGVKYYVALNEDLVYVPVSSNTSFASNVIIPDHAYDSTSKLQSNIVANYYIKLPKKKTLQLFMNYRTLTALDAKHMQYTADLNTKASTYFNGGISINY
jgi:hypothetical protein